MAATIGCGNPSSPVTGDAAVADTSTSDAAVDAPTHPMPTAEPADPVGAPCTGRLGFPDLPLFGLDFSSSRLMRAADVTGDGRVDLILLQGASIGVAAGNGDGTFATPTSINLGTGPSALILHDVNGDGKPDLVFTTSDQLAASSTIQVAVNTGAGAFATPIAYETSINLSDVAAADVNGDGKTDLFGLERYSHRMAVLLATATGFANPVYYATGTDTTYRFELADVTGDGTVDVVALDAAKTVNVIANQGNGTFAAPVPYTTANAASAVVLEDVNHDGKRDIVVAGAGSLGDIIASVRLAQSNGTFGNAMESLIAKNQTAIGVPQHLVATDLDGDGDVDLIGASMSSVPAKLALGDDAGHFTAADVPIDTDVFSLAVGDFDNDAKPDVALGTSTAGILVYRNHGGAQPFEFPKPQVLSGAIRLWSASTVDINSDGKLDVLTVDTADQTAYAVMATTPGQFTGSHDAVSIAVDGRYSGLADFNNDGRQDLFAVGSVAGFTPSGGRVVLNEGNGTLSAGAMIEIPYMYQRPDRMAAGDLDNDGIRDVVITARVEEGSRVSTAYFAHGLGNGNFSTPILIWTGALALGAAIGDLDHDGNNDVVLGASTSDGNSGQLVILPGRGDGTFASPITSNLHGLRIALRDLNHDGKLDLVSWGLGVEVQLGQGGFAFGPPMQATSTNAFEVTFADFDGNGALDIVAIGQSASSILLGHGDGTFTRNGTYFTRSEYAGVRPTDLNADGHLDLLVSYEDHVTTILGHCY